MTFEEAMKILNKEIFGIRIKKFDKPLKFEEKLWIRNEKPEVLEALHIVAKNGISVYVPKTALRIRSLIIEKMKAGEGAPAPVSGTPLSAVEGMKLQRKDNKNTDKNPALKESATQFNDALLDEQAKKIKHLTKKITRLNKIIHKKNMKIEELKEHLKESKESAMKYASLLSDAYEELRELKKKLANKVVDNIDAQALKSAESALAWKENVIDKLAKENNDYKKCVEEFRNKIADMTIGKIDIQNIRLKEKNKEIKELNDKLKSINMNRHNELAEKDEVIADLGKELAEAKKHQQQAYRSCADKNKEIRALKLQISALEKRGNGIDWKRNADAIKLYVNRASHERLWSPISQDICNEQELSFIINHGGKRVKYALRFDGTDIVYECSDPDKKPSFFRDDSVGAVTNQKDCSPVKDTHSTEDNPEEIEIEKAVKLVRKAMKEGRTVTIDYKD